MRDSLTVLAILLICLLTAALVAPYFVDWTAHRGLIEARLSKAAGTRITIAGPISIRLLPQPTFRLGQVTIGDPSPGQASLTAAELDVDIALTALMRGDLQVGEAVLRSPRLDLATEADGAIKLRIPGLSDPARVKFEHVVVENGTLSVTQPGRPALTMTGLDFYGEATSLAGPFKATGSFGRPDDRQAFRLSTGEFEGGKLRLKLAFDATTSLPALDLDGTATPGGGTAQKPVGPSLEGLLTLKGKALLAGNPATIPWSLAGHIRADRDAATSTDLEFRAGTDMRAINATGSGTLALTPEPHAALHLHGPQLNFDLLAVAPDKSSVAPPKGAALLGALNAQWNRDGAPGLPLRLDVAYAFDTASVGAVTILGLSGDVDLDGGKDTRVTLKAQGPDSASLMLDGRYEGGAAPVFRGRLDASLRDLPRFSSWLAPALPAEAVRMLGAIPARGLSFKGDVDLSRVGIAARDATLRLDRSDLRGTLTYTGAIGDDRARLFADLSSDGLSLDDLPDLSASTGTWDDVDLDVALQARAVKIVPTGIGSVDAGTLALRLHKTGESAVLDSFAADLGSASLTATGSLDKSAATLDAHVDAPQLDALAELMTHLMPGTATTWLRNRASSLSPTKADLGFRATQTADGSLLPTALVLDTTANGSRIKATLKPDAPGDLDPETSVVSLDLTAEAPQGLVLLHQLGLPSAVAAGPVPQIGPGRIKGRAHGSAAEGFESSVDGTIGGVVVSFQGRSKPDRGTGHLALKGSDLAPLLRSTGIVAAGSAAGSAAIWPADAEADLTWHDGNLAFRRLRGTAGASRFSGDLDAVVATPAPGQAEKPALFGNLTIERLSLPSVLDVALGPAPRQDADLWSSQPFGAPLVQWPRTQIAIKTKAFALRNGLDVRDASLTLRADRRGVTLGDITGTFGAGSLGGTLTLRRDGPAASLTGAVSWSGIAVDLPGLAGRVGGTMDFGGSGASPLALIGSMAGTGSVTIADGRIARFDPSALSRAAVQAETNTSDVDAEQIRDMVLPDLERGPLRLGDVAGQGTLAQGVFHLGPLRIATGDWTSDADASVDLKDFSFASKTVVRVRQPLPDWKGEAPQISLLLDGPIDAPHREVDAAAFVNVLQSRAIARDQERIDTMQQDIRERAFFNRRLKAIEAEQAAARPATPLPLPRPTVLPGVKGPTAAPKANRPAAQKPVPGSLPDPSSAGPF